jgi:rSAM/selenodomain-associated transferase 1
MGGERAIPFHGRPAASSPRTLFLFLGNSPRFYPDLMQIAGFRSKFACIASDVKSQKFFNSRHFLLTFRLLNNERLIIFVKAPRPGAVKTRLALGPKAECAAYQRLVQVILSQFMQFRDVELRYTPADGQREIQPWLRQGWRASPQGEGDLGDRLNKAFADAFAAGAERIAIIGSDCPYLSAEDIRSAWAQLRSCDLVLGPAEDGGYWLIGLRQRQPALFTGMPWSSRHVFNETVARAKRLGLKTSLLRTLSDVDTPEDWKRFISAAASAQRPHQSPGAN